eukprot:1105925-Pleurochrysis_carterae.AAC.1
MSGRVGRGETNEWRDTPKYLAARKRSRANMIRATADNERAAGSRFKQVLTCQGAQRPEQLSSFCCARAPAKPCW